MTCGIKLYDIIKTSSYQDLEQLDSTRNQQQCWALITGASPEQKAPMLCSCSVIAKVQPALAAEPSIHFPVP